MITRNEYMASYARVGVGDLPSIMEEMPVDDLARCWVAMLVDATAMDAVDQLGEERIGLAALALALCTVSRRLHGTRYELEALMPTGFEIKKGSRPDPSRLGGRGSSCPLRAAMVALEPGEWIDVDPAVYKRTGVYARLMTLRKNGHAGLKSYTATGGRIVVFREHEEKPKARRKTE